MGPILLEINRSKLTRSTGLDSMVGTKPTLFGQLHDRYSYALPCLILVDSDPLMVSTIIMAMDIMVEDIMLLEATMVEAMDFLVTVLVQGLLEGSMEEVGCMVDLEGG